MAPDEQLKWEERFAVPAAIASALSVLLAIISGFYLASRIEGRPDTDAERLTALDQYASDYIVSAALSAISLALLAVPLWYLYRAAAARGRIQRPALIFAIGGPIALAILSMILQFNALDEAATFVDERLTGAAADRRAEELRDAQPWGVLVPYYAGGLVTGVGFVLVCMAAMRVGLLSRLMGVVGAAVGVAYVLSPVFPGAGFLQLFWLPAIAALVLNRWPGGRGPAWEKVEAAPWPTAEDRRAQMQAGGAGRGTAPEPEPDDEPAPAELAQQSGANGASADGDGARSKKRKKKRRR